MGEEKKGESQPHILTKQELEQAKQGMKSFLDLIFEADARGQISLTREELGPGLEHTGLIDPKVTHDNLVALWMLGRGMGLDLEVLKGLHNNPKWQDLFASGGIPQKGESVTGWE